VKLDKREEFNIRDSGMMCGLYRAVNWLPKAQREKRTLCD